MDEVRLFRTRDNRLVRIGRLTEQLARTHANRLTLLHNLIPFQHWNVENLLAASDATRQFLAKWEISRLAIDEHDQVIGFCIGFELSPDGITYNRPGVYMHRLSVDPGYRNQFVGALLQAEASTFCFSRGLRYTDPSSEVVLFGQTNDIPENAHMLKFYHDAGFEVIGQKQYPDRLDVVMQMTRQSFAASRHAALRVDCLIDE